VAELPSVPRGEELATHGRFLRSLARSLVAPAEQEDLVQETLTRALASPPRNDTGLRAWLARILRHAAHARGQREAERHAREETAFHARPARSSDDPAEVAAELELSRRVLESVERLREPYRSTLYLRYYRGLAPERIAAESGTPIKTVKTRLARGLEELRQELDRLYGGDRRAWVVLLLPLARPEAPVLPATPAAPVASGGVVLAGALSLAAATTLALIFLDGDESLRGEPVASDLSAPLVDAAVPPPQALPVTRERLPDVASETLPVRDLGIRVRGRVLDLEGAALAGVELEATRLSRESGARRGAEFERSEVLARARSEGDGRFELVLDDPGAVRVSLARDGFAPLGHRLLVYAAQELDLGELVLEPGVELNGSVRDDSGRPLSGIELWQPLRDLGLSHGRAESWFLAGTSAADGSFRLTRVPAGSWRLEARSPLYREETLSGEAAAGSRLASLELVLLSGERIAGVVLGLDAQQLASSRVVAIALGDARDGRRAGPRLVSPAADGRFEFGGYTPGSEVELALVSGPERRATATLRAPSGSLDLVLHATAAPTDGSARFDSAPAAGEGGSLLVTVRSADGTPAPGALVRAVPLERPREGEVRAADVTGRAWFEDLEPGAHALSVVAGVFEPWFASAAGDPVVSVASGETTRAQLPALLLGRLEGLVRVQGLPLAGAEVRVRPNGDEDARRGPSPSLCARSDAGGSFRFESLPPGDYLVHLSHPSTPVPVEQPITLTEGVNRLALELVRQTLEGRVLAADGQPLPDARVYPREAERRGDPRGTRVPLTRTDASGGFRLEGLELDALPALEFEAEGYALRVVTAPASPLLVTLEREAPVRLVTIGPRPAFCRLLAYGPQGERLQFVLRASDEQPLELHGFGPGRWTLGLDEGPLRPGRGASRSEGQVVREIQLVEGEPFEFRLERE